MRRTNNNLLTLFFPLLIIASSCLEEGGKDFTENVKEVYKLCDKEKIKFLAQKYLVQLAFEPCGSNNFLAYTWSPDGLILYYQLTSGSYLLDVEEKNTDRKVRYIPIPKPSANPVWINTVLLAYPIFDNGKWSIDFYNIKTNVLNRVKVDVEEIDSMNIGESNDILYFLAAKKGKRKRVYRFDASTGKLEEAWTELPQDLSNFSCNFERGLIAYNEQGKEEVSLFSMKDRRVVKTLHGHRAVFSKDGRYLSIERKGKPIDNITKKILTPEEVMEKDKKPGLEGLKGYVYAPEISIYSIENDREFTIEEIHGYKTEWYPAVGEYHLSFILWGFEREELNRNITLFDLTAKILEKLGTQI